MARRSWKEPFMLRSVTRVEAEGVLGSGAWRAARTLAPCSSSSAAGCASSWRGAKDPGVSTRSREPAHILSGPATSHSSPPQASAGTPGRWEGWERELNGDTCKVLAGPQPQPRFVSFILVFGGRRSDSQLPGSYSRIFSVYL